MGQPFNPAQHTTRLHYCGEETLVFLLIVVIVSVENLMEFKVQKMLMWINECP